MGDYYGSGGGGGGGAKKSAATASSLPPGAVSVPGSTLAHSDHAKIFVGGLSWQTTEESLRWHFETYGPVVSVEVMRDRVTGDPRGFAFVVFADSATVDLVMQHKDEHEINHKLVDVKRAQARGVAPPSIHERQQAQLLLQQKQQQQQATAATSAESSSSPAGAIASSVPNSSNDANTPTPEQLQTKVFVGGIPPQVDRDELTRIFEQFGNVVDAIVMLDQHTQRSRGFGFVTFSPTQHDGTPGSAAAQRALQAQPVDIHGRSVEVKLATPRAEQPGFHHKQQQQPHMAQQQQHGTQRTLPPGPKHVGLRAGQASASAAGEFAGLAVAFGRSGWKAGYGTKAFGKAGWDVWEDTLGAPPERAGFSFDKVLLLQQQQNGDAQPQLPGQPPAKRARHG